MRAFGGIAVSVADDLFSFEVAGGNVPRVVVGAAKIGLQIVRVDHLSSGLAPLGESLTLGSTASIPRNTLSSMTMETRWWRGSIRTSMRPVSLGAKCKLCDGWRDRKFCVRSP